jgi:hypothetical protein
VKAGGVFLSFVLPFLGALIYLIARTTMTEQDREEIQRGRRNRSVAPRAVPQQTRSPSSRSCTRPARLRTRSTKEEFTAKKQIPGI